MANSKTTYLTRIDADTLSKIISKINKNGIDSIENFKGFNKESITILSNNEKDFLSFKLALKGFIKEMASARVRVDTPIDIWKYPILVKYI